MKQLWRNVLMISGLMFIFSGCGQKTGETISNLKIPYEDVTEFYYTYENINFDASYQRYWFYKEDGKAMFYHETRERPGEYGPATQEDITRSGTVELSQEEWQSFLDLLKDGSVSKRGDSAQAGGSGPWMFIYWKKDKGKYQVFDFPDYEARVRFEEYCLSLAQ